MRRVTVIVPALILMLAATASAGPLHADPDDTSSRVDIASARLKAAPGIAHRRVIVVTTYEDMRLRAMTRRITIYLDTRRGPGFDVGVTVEDDGASAGLTCYVGSRGAPDPPFQLHRCVIEPRRITISFDVWPHRRLRWRVAAAEGQVNLTAMLTVDSAPDAGWYPGG